MTTDRLVLDTLNEVFDSFPGQAPDGLLEATLGAVRLTRQRPGWQVRLSRGGGPGSLGRVAAFVGAGAAVIVLALAMAWLAGRSFKPTEPAATLPVVAPPTSVVTTSPLPTASPEAEQGWRRATADAFEIPFEYDLPPDGTASSRVEHDLVLLYGPAPSGTNGSTQEQSDLYHYRQSGILVASTADASIDWCPRKIGEVVLQPGEDLIAQLEDQGMTVQATADQLDGMSAARVEIRAECLDHVHLGGRAGLGWKTLLLTADAESGRPPFYLRTYFLPVGDTTLIVQAWGATPDEFAAWLPTAERVIRSIHFLDLGASPEETPEASQSWQHVSVDSFEVPLEYDLPQDGITVARSESNLVVMESPLGTESLLPAPSSGDLYSSPMNGLMIATTSGATIDSCPRKFGASELVGLDLVAQLAAQGMSVTSTPVTIDDREALRVEIDAECLDHIHLGVLTDASHTIRLSATERNLTYFLPLDDTTVVIQAWGASPEEFAAWLPTAERIIASLSFTPPANPANNGSVTFGQFDLPFTIEPPKGAVVLSRSPSWSSLIVPLEGAAGSPLPVGLFAYQSGYRGLIVANATGASFSRCSLGSTLIQPGDDLIATVEASGDFTFETVAGPRIDGYRSQAFTVDGSCSPTLTIRDEGGHGVTLLMRRGNTANYLLTVGTTTLVIQAYAPPFGLADWQPIAEQAMESIHFIP